MTKSLKLKLVEYDLIPAFRLRRRQHKELESWQLNGHGPFPNLLKQKMVLECAEKTGARTLIETGTYYGLMLQACLGHFDKLYSIEVEPHFYRRAVRVFRNHPEVTILLGDSAELLPSLLKKINSPCLFWLDAHYSAGLTGRGNAYTPVLSEMDAIFNHGLHHAILIDDAVCFDGKNYPTLDAVRDLATAAGYAFSKTHDVIWLT